MKTIETLNFIAYLQRGVNNGVSDVTFFFKPKQKPNELCNFMLGFYYCDVDKNAYGTRYRFKISNVKDEVGSAAKENYIRPLIELSLPELKEQCKAARLSVKDLDNFVKQFND